MRDPPLHNVTAVLTQLTWLRHLQLLHPEHIRLSLHAGWCHSIFNSCKVKCNSILCRKTSCPVSVIKAKGWWFMMLVKAEKCALLSLVMEGTFWTSFNWTFSHRLDPGELYLHAVWLYLILSKGERKPLQAEMEKVHLVPGSDSFSTWIMVMQTLDSHFQVQGSMYTWEATSCVCL